PREQAALQLGRAKYASHEIWHGKAPWRPLESLRGGDDQTAITARGGRPDGPPRARGTPEGQRARARRLDQRLWQDAGPQAAAARQHPRWLGGPAAGEAQVRRLGGHGAEVLPPVGQTETPLVRHWHHALAPVGTGVPALAHLGRLAPADIRRDQRRDGVQPDVV